MTRKHKMAVARFIPRDTSAIRFVNLLPQLASETTPPGFNVIFLPYADDMRNPESLLETQEEVKLAPVNWVKLAAAMCNELQLRNFSESNFTNPSLQHFYSRLEALALESNQPREVEDTLEPDQEGLQRHASHIETFFKVAAPERAVTATKRQGNASTGFKKVKVEPSSVEEIRKLAEEPNAINKKTVAVLKDFCSVLGLNPAGKKPEIVSKIINYFKN